MTRLGRQDQRGASARTDGSVVTRATSVPPSAPARRARRRRESRLFDRRMRDRHGRVVAVRARHVGDDRTTHPARPPGSSGATTIAPNSVKPQGRATPAEVRDLRGRPVAETPKRDRPEVWPPSDNERATRLVCAEGDQTSGEVPAPAKNCRTGPIVTGPPVVPESADCFGAAGRSRARTPRRR
jgi:hypothetical protein